MRVFLAASRKIWETSHVKSMNEHGCSDNNPFHFRMHTFSFDIIVETEQRQGSSSDDHRAFDCQTELCE